MLDSTWNWCLKQVLPLVIFWEEGEILPSSTPADSSHLGVRISPKVPHNPTRIQQGQCSNLHRRPKKKGLLKMERKSRPANKPVPVESEEEAPAATSKAKAKGCVGVESEEEAHKADPNSKERLQAIFAKAKSSPLTPNDRAELVAGEANTPWARRVKLRSEPSQNSPWTC